MKSIDQCRKFHAMVRDIARHIPVWCEMRMDEEDWKRLLLAGAFGQKVVPNPIGAGFLIMNNRRVRDMEMPNMADLITQVQAFGNERGVDWSDPEWQAQMRAYEEEAVA